jgi:hypothetical protein
LASGRMGWLLGLIPIDEWLLDYLCFTGEWRNTISDTEKATWYNRKFSPPLSPPWWRTSTKWQKKRKDESRWERETGSWETSLHYMCVCMHSKRENSSRETWAPVSLVDGWWKMAEAIALYV